MADTYRIEMKQTGASSVLEQKRFKLPPPSKGEVRLRQTYIGVNFVDIYFRSGLYPTAQFPATLGVEAVGVVEALGEGVTEVQVGQRVAYAGGQSGSYCSHRNITVKRLLPIPDTLSDQTVAASLLRGMTAFMLLNKIYPVKTGDTLLVHAAAGGLGQILGQWGRALGARLIGTVGSQSKVSRAKEKGYENLILYKDQDIVAQVKQLTHETGVDYVIDGIGGSTLKQSFACVRPFGMVAGVGQVAGAPDTLSISSLPKSVAYIRPSVLQYIADDGLYQHAGQVVIQKLVAGTLEVEIGSILPLANASKAHQLLEAGQTTGVLLLNVE